MNEEYYNFTAKEISKIYNNFKKGDKITNGDYISIKYFIEVIRPQYYEKI